MSMQLDSIHQQPSDEFKHYRALSSSAVVALIIGFVSFASLLFPTLLFLPLIGVILGILAILKVRRQSDELTGAPLAIMGTIVSVVLLVGGSILHSVVYITEVPEGYERISFYDLRSETQQRDVPPDSAFQLDGKRVFVKGYVHPSVADVGRVKQFMLVGDMKTCCFGGNPRLTEMIQVDVSGPPGLAFSFKKRKLGGVLRVDKKMKPRSGLQGGYYRLEADYLK